MDKQLATIQKLKAVYLAQFCEDPVDGTKFDCAVLDSLIALEQQCTAEGRKAREEQLEKLLSANLVMNVKELAAALGKPVGAFSLLFDKGLTSVFEHIDRKKLVFEHAARKKLVQLPSGDWIDPKTVVSVQRHLAGNEHQARVVVRGDNGTYLISYFKDDEEAYQACDAIGKQVNQARKD